MSNNYEYGQLPEVCVLNDNSRGQIITFVLVASKFLCNDHQLMALSKTESFSSPKYTNEQISLFSPGCQDFRLPRRLLQNSR